MFVFVCLCAAVYGVIKNNNNKIAPSYCAFRHHVFWAPSAHIPKQTAVSVSVPENVFNARFFEF